MSSERQTDRALNPLALSPEELAFILRRVSGYDITVAMIRSDIDAGAPVNPDGTINIIHYTAWLLLEEGRGT